MQVRSLIRDSRFENPYLKGMKTSYLPKCSLVPPRQLTPCGRRLLFMTAVLRPAYICMRLDQWRKVISGEERLSINTKSFYYCLDGVEIWHLTEILNQLLCYLI